MYITSLSRTYLKLETLLTLIKDLSTCSCEVSSLHGVTALRSSSRKEGIMCWMCAGDYSET